MKALLQKIGLGAPEQEAPTPRAKDSDKAERENMRKQLVRIRHMLTEYELHARRR